ncbi:MAG: M15 family metallopeptidase [Acidobacteria bacterium]|nr:M15 family metallopeptidase [Acidobacteriota bacterium]
MFVTFGRGGARPGGRAAVVVAVVLAALLAVLAPAPPSSAKSLSAQRRAIRARRARAAAQVDVLRASDAQIKRALGALDADVRTKEGAVSNARFATAAATRAAQEAKAAEEAAARQLEHLRVAVRAIAVDQFIHGSRTVRLGPHPDDSASDAARRAFLGQIGAESATDLQDQLRSTGQDLARHRQEADAASALARQRQASVEQSLSAVRAAQGRQRGVANQVEARLEQRLAEAASLAAIDARLAAEITRQQNALVRRLPHVGGRLPSIRVGSVSVTAVGGIVVATSIARQVARLLAAAAANGVRLSGGGYRSSAAQVASRRSHCGSSYYDIYRKPASQCRPPSARPGLSMHERGLAIDFVYGGSIVSRHSPGYRWLRANAGRYGLHNLPSEPWHWSTNGN